MFIIRQHKDDRDMLEIITRKCSKIAPREIITLWAVVYEDFIHEVMPNDDAKHDILDIIKSGAEVELELVKA